MELDCHLFCCFIMQVSIQNIKNRSVQTSNNHMKPNRARSNLFDFKFSKLKTSRVDLEKIEFYEYIQVMLKLSQHYNVLI
ncbi:CLUMA_CG005778, isoform A [Clunio marinus]|uniref:CLUMA_CG005778, isoform A n=1 Tax=Clunio marinus TaxID=568069 RepID=A0A1J1I060_9DIPT|nr:CLUMA_CG005778, isoform A [Clunio marinus]